MACDAWVLWMCGGGISKAAPQGNHAVCRRGQVSTRSLATVPLRTHLNVVVEVVFVPLLRVVIRSGLKRAA